MAASNESTDPDAVTGPSSPVAPALPGDSTRNPNPEPENPNPKDSS
jgi:hypothetical protein